MVKHVYVLMGWVLIWPVFLVHFWKVVFLFLNFDSCFILCFCGWLGELNLHTFWSGKLQHIPYDLLSWINNLKPWPNYLPILTNKAVMKQEMFQRFSILWTQVSAKIISSLNRQWMTHLVEEGHFAGFPSFHGCVHRKDSFFLDATFWKCDFSVNQPDFLGIHQNSSERLAAHKAIGKTLETFPTPNFGVAKWFPRYATRRDEIHALSCLYVLPVQTNLGKTHIKNLYHTINPSRYQAAFSKQRTKRFFMKESFF